MQVIEIGHRKLINADFFTTVDSIVAPETVDLVLTDAPYNIADKGKVTKYQGKIYSNKEAWGDAFKNHFTREEYDEFITKFLVKSFTLLRPGGSLITFIDRRYAGCLADLAEKSGFLYKNMIVFVKKNCVPKIRSYNYASATEFAVWFIRPANVKSKTKPGIFNYNKPVKNLRHPDGRLDVEQYHNTYSSNVFFYNIGNKLFGHPTEKYSGQVIPLIETHSNPDSLILDPFGGSFAIGHYAESLGRRYVGFEINTSMFNEYSARHK